MIMMTTGLLTPPLTPTRKAIASPEWFVPHSSTPYSMMPMTPPSDDCKAAPTPIIQTKRPSYQQHRRASAPTYFADASTLCLLPTPPRRPFRPRLASLPLSGNISPLWNIEEELSSGENDEFLTPKDMHDDGFIISRRRVNVASFKPRQLGQRPRWQRPILLVVFCIMLFGSLCIMIRTHQLATGLEKPLPLVYIKRVGKYAAPRFELSTTEQLAVLTNFITATAANVFPSDQHDIASLLPFDAGAPNARAELDEIIREQWDQYPIMVLGKLRDPVMRETKRILHSYNIRPEPEFVEIDQRADALHVEELLARLLNGTGPYLLLKGKLASGVPQMEEAKSLVSVFADAGISIAKKLKKTKHAKEQARAENERVLGPK